MAKQFLLIIGFIFSTQVMSQTGIGTTTPHASAKLEVASDRLGFLPPRVSLTGISDNTTIPSPATGLLVYCKGDAGLSSGYYFWNGTTWATIATSEGSNSVEYVSVQSSSDLTITTGSVVKFNSVLSGNIPYDASTGFFTLSAGKTYRITGVVTLTGFPLTTSDAEAVTVWRTGSGTNIGNYSQIFSVQAQTNRNGQGITDFIYTPITNITVSLYVNSISGNVGFRGGYTSATITQVGSSATVNPWTLSGTNTFNTTGNVGIGNTSPTKVLDVTGDAKVSGVLTAGGNAYPTSQGDNGYALTTNGSGVASWNSLPPIGVISAFAGSSAPLGYLLCNGSAVSRTTYASLFSVIGTTYGSGNGSSTFNLPDLRSRTIVGVGQGVSLTNRTLASTGGIESKTLSINEIPAHNHGITDPGHSHTQTTVNDDFNNSPQNPPGFTTDGGGSRTWSNINSSTTGISINNAGGGNSFNLMNPFISLNYIIKF